MSDRLVGKVAVVTGAGQGIGRATVASYVAEGAEVWALDHNPVTLDTLALEFPGTHTRLVDVTDTAAIASFADEADAVDVLFNCAGVVQHGTVLDTEESEWSFGLDVNVTSMYRMIRALLPAMLTGGGGAIINMASVVSSVAGVPNRFVYGTSKAAVIGLTKAVAADFISDGIRCNAIAPGTVQSPSLDERLAGLGDVEEARAAFVARQPMGRLGTAEEIAALAVYLACDEAAYATGSVFVVDGGMTL
jgi:2-keto-3-deoxy-L-fuconate dehydrogenase